jgi:hypothetical protein
MRKMIISLSLLLVGVMTSLGGPIIGLVDRSTGAEVPDADARYVKGGSSNLVVGSLTVSNDVVIMGGLNVGSNVTAVKYIGDGSLLTGIIPPTLQNVLNIGNGATNSAMAIGTTNVSQGKVTIQGESGIYTNLPLLVINRTTNGTGKIISYRTNGVEVASVDMNGRYTGDGSLLTGLVTNSGVTYSRKWFVSSETGNDSKDGTSEANAFATLRLAIENCAVGDLVYVTDRATYTLDSVLSIPSGVAVYMPNASLAGEIQLSTSSRFIAKSHAPSTNGQTMVSCIGTAGAAYNVYGMNSTGYSNIKHFKASAVGGYIVANAFHITVGSTTAGSTNILVYSTSGSSGVNIATVGANFSSDKALNYGYAANLVEGSAGYCQWSIAAVSLPVTITYSNGAASTVTSYKIKATSSTTRTPKSWTVEGKLGAGAWTQISAETNITAWTAYEMKTFAVASSGSYDQYRIIVSAANHAEWLQLDDMSLLAGVDSVGGDILIDSKILSLGEYAHGIQSHDADQRVISNISNVYPIDGTSNQTFIVMSDGLVSHRGNVVTVDSVWSKTGGTLTWDTSFDAGAKSGEATSYTVKNTDSLVVNAVTNNQASVTLGNLTVVGSAIIETNLTVKGAIISSSIVSNTPAGIAAAGGALTSDVSFAAAPACYQLVITNTSPLSWTNTWMPTSKVSRVTLTSTGTTTFVWNWPTQQDAGMRFALDMTGMPSVVFPAGAIYLVNGVFTNTAPSLFKSNYVSVIHDCNTYQIMAITNTIGTWGTP